ncbi:MAG: zf-HC2 domain-containing protein [Actinomycetota bacterium]|nr:zf-HC2 domain-containing protein [Acidimicrobiia bacterium]MDQ3293952.1 zf-HC2 domain-containing protein [Actinomycetota bacterium]
MAGHDCDDLLHELGHLLHGDLPEARRVALQRHLEECPPCLETADFQAQLRGMIAKRCFEQVPDDLAEKVKRLLDSA